MNADLALAFAEELLCEYGLDDWTVQFDRSKNRFGQCRYGTQTISLSKPLVLLNSEQRVLNTILHEIAHALVGPGHGHDYVWRRQAKAIGCDGQRCFSPKTVETPPHAWIGTCPSCGATLGRHRLTDKAKRVTCSPCGKGRYDARFRFVWQRQAA